MERKQSGKKLVTKGIPHHYPDNKTRGHYKNKTTQQQQQNPRGQNL